ncbi:branched-chain amino acid transporter permease [Wolinella succinogenes]|uniref:Branched-chain amino acid ABC transporter n=1 Tax=Wolinella succinogenes (strain ATCC 29543 / DSM 1740 / CCUG 13145 / JCM 31913 / LMG 7466 / NCTC 11488 / FDC 602W) TaxID=273121 RepID=Q7MRI7_WOLSU|nr:AzlD domain-containing protein [Wolinella succinogenes]CAE10395.1 hypothetical protein WS1319 [Wolinella succinogenes]VEG80480.1 Predicted membrane protein [Wolinella succinogenes]HCZ19817.1 branched-chain amino acid ABC transporter [Helicobacter sp.]
MNHEYLLLAILVAALATYVTRILAFWLFGRSKPSSWLLFLQQNMPLAIMTILVFYALKEVSWSESYGWRELGGIALSVVTHLWFRNALLSIFSGVLFYMTVLHLF